MVLFTALFLVIIDRHGHESAVFSPSTVYRELKGLRAPGWTVSELPLAETEFSRDIVAKSLRYDEYAYLHFASATRSFSVYVAYWKPGKVEIREVNTHTPDTCWVNSGWSTRWRQGGFAGAGPTAELQPGQYRCYENGGVVQYVAFWHLIGGESVPMWRNGMPLPSFMWRLLVSERRLLRAEQYFVRIASPSPLAEIWTEDAFQKVLTTLKAAGLAAK